MIGAIIGDIIGSTYGIHNVKTKDFPLFTEYSHMTDGSMMTLAIEQALTNTKGRLEGLSEQVIICMRSIGRRFPNAGYGDLFYNWLFSDNPRPYGSWGNGAAMRVSSVGYYAETRNESELLSDKVTMVTHDHPDAIKGARAIAYAVYLADSGYDKDVIRNEIRQYHYPLNFTLNEIRDNYKFDMSCQGSVPQAIEAFLESISYEDCIRNSISIGGYSSTIACIAGSIAEAYNVDSNYRIPLEIMSEASKHMTKDEKELIREIFSAPINGNIPSDNDMRTNDMMFLKILNNQ